MGATIPLSVSSTKSASSSSDDIMKKIKEGKTNELIIGLTGPLCSGLTTISKELKEILEGKGYKCHLIKVSSFIKDHATKVGEKYNNSEKYSERVNNLQDIGDKIRNHYRKNYALAVLCCQKINFIRFTEDKEFFEKKPDLKIAYIIDSLKHPEEVELLRSVYTKGFYLFGVDSTIEVAKQRALSMKNTTPEDFMKVASRDTNDAEKSYGQKVSKTLVKSDFFINNDSSSTTGTLKARLQRFVDLALGSGLITPNVHESSMYLAHATAAKSACLSRQVGAVIVNLDGHVIATGHNDVPKSGGGLYSVDGQLDQRCYVKGAKCFNDLEKSIIYDQVIEELVEAKIISEAQRIETIKAIKESKIKDLIEFSRAVHAEMNAIVSVATSTHSSTKNTHMYCTTYPCHSCARHIVAAGISKVFYIEPYTKSLALKLHEDAITNNPAESNKVCFSPYEGVAPTRFLSYFSAQGDRKRDGSMIITETNALEPKDRLEVDDFYNKETKVINHGEEIGLVEN